MHNKIKVTYFNGTKFTDNTITLPHYIEDSPDPYTSITNYICKTLNIYEESIQYWDYTKDSEYSRSRQKITPNIDVVVKERNRLQEELISEVRYLRSGSNLDLQISKIKKLLEDFKRISKLCEYDYRS